MNKEIERKFLVKEIPSDLQELSKFTIFQRYLAVGEEEVRIRAMYSERGSNYNLFYHTIKRGKGLSREEIETQISEKTYSQMIKYMNDIPIHKIRTTCKYNNFLLELDNYLAEYFPLKVVEIEFASEEGAESFVPFDWLGEEITEDKRYKNQNLWLNINPLWRL